MTIPPKCPRCHRPLEHIYGPGVRELFVCVECDYEVSPEDIKADAEYAATERALDARMLKRVGKEVMKLDTLN